MKLYFILKEDFFATICFLYNFIMLLASESYQIFQSFNFILRTVEARYFIK